MTKAQKLYNAWYYPFEWVLAVSPWRSQVIHFALLDVNWEAGF